MTQNTSSLLPSLPPSLPPSSLPPHRLASKSPKGFRRGRQGQAQVCRAQVLAEETASEANPPRAPLQVSAFGHPPLGAEGSEGFLGGRQRGHVRQRQERREEVIGLADIPGGIGGGE